MSLFIPKENVTREINGLNIQIAVKDVPMSQAEAERLGLVEGVEGVGMVSTDVSTVGSTLEVPKTEAQRRSDAEVLRVQNPDGATPRDVMNHESDVTGKKPTTTAINKSDITKTK